MAVISKWLSPIKFFVGAAVVAYGLLYFREMNQNQLELQQQVLDAAVEKVSVEATLQAAANANVLLIDALEERERSLMRAEERLESLQQSFLDLQEEASEQRAVFDDHNFERLVEGRPTLIESLANSATKERFDQFEQIFDGT